MNLPIHSALIVAAAAASLMSSAALAQTAEPKAGSPTATVTTTTTNVTTTKWMTEETLGQWRASRLIGLNIYNNANEKVGDISDIILDRSGKLESIVVGAGGFLGIGERDVAVPYDEIKWVYTPVPSPGTDTSPTTTSGDAKAISGRYPNHGVLNMTKDQLKAAPAFKFSS